METWREAPSKGGSNLEQKRKKKFISFIEKASKFCHIKSKKHCRKRHEVQSQLTPAQIETPSGPRVCFACVATNNNIN
jgi:hypothetical protein